MKAFPGSPASHRLRSYALPVAASLLASMVLAGCRGDAPLPPVFGAVFGLSGAAVDPYTVGRIAEPSIAPGDTVIGTAANAQGLCIWRTSGDKRFRAACPEGYGR